MNRGFKFGVGLIDVDVPPKELVRVGLKTIVVMAGVCALQANPRIVQPYSGCTTKLCYAMLHFGAVVRT